MSDTNVKPRSQLAEEFIFEFTQQKDELSSQITQLTSESGSAVNDRLNTISKDIQELSKQLHDAIIFLPAYSVKMRQNEIRELERALKEKEDLLAPKKKFGFRSKIAVPPVEVPASVPPSQKPALNAETQQDSKNLPTTRADNYFTIENLQSKSVQFGESELNGNDVLVKNCEGATIVLEGSASTLRLTNLKKCKLLTGPVRTSIFVENVQDSMLYLCCQQLRTHSSERVDIYLRVGSRAIIEDCKEIRFGPYQWNHPKSKELHNKAEISPDLERYDAVDDFNWLSSTPSPNWSLIPTENRVPFPSS